MPRKRKQKPVRKGRCATCVTKTPEEGGIYLRPGALDEIQLNAIQGICQGCHGDDNRTLCRGIRDYQLMIWARMGWIEEPTDEALAEAMAHVNSI